MCNTYFITYLCRISPVRVISKNSNSCWSIDEKRLYLIRMATFSPTFDNILMHKNVDKPYAKKKNTR